MADSLLAIWRVGLSSGQLDTRLDPRRKLDVNTVQPPIWCAPDTCQAASGTGGTEPVRRTTCPVHTAHLSHEASRGASQARPKAARGPAHARAEASHGR